MELAVGPELQIVEVVWASLDVVIHSTVLEVQQSVTPEGAQLVRSADNPPNKALFATKLWRCIVGIDLEHNGVDRNALNLVLEVILVLISPPIDIVGLKINLEGPVWLFFLLTVLIIVCHVHYGGGTHVICHSCHVLSDSFSGTLVVVLTKDGRPAILEEVERLLPIKGEHCQGVR